MSAGAGRICATHGWGMYDDPAPMAAICENPADVHTTSAGREATSAVVYVSIAAVAFAEPGSPAYACEKASTFCMG